MNFDVIIIGGGAAGLMCAIEAGKRGRTVVVIEHNGAIGKKIKISGGGRCNFTNLQTAPENFISENMSFAKSALARYTPADFIKLVRRHDISFHEKKLGQLFCDGSSQQIIDLLSRECAQAPVEIRTGCRISEIRKPKRFVVTSNLGDLSSDVVVVATGGVSVPKIGTSDLGYRIARQFGLRVSDIRPGLVPLTFDGRERAFMDLAGVSIDAQVSAGEIRFRESVLFTHHGLSGPAILQISSYVTPGDDFTVDLLPQTGDASIHPRELQHLLPKRFAQKWCELYAPSKAPAQWSRSEIDDFQRRLHNWKLRPKGTEGFPKAEVTVGGVDTNELSSKTMESRRIPGLYFIGEVVDVTGQLGGFNFQWAWASGFAAGQVV